jgi:hypothetical protein
MNVAHIMLYCTTNQWGRKNCHERATMYLVCGNGNMKEATHFAKNQLYWEYHTLRAEVLQS